MVGTGKLSRVLWCNWVSWHLVSCTPHNQHFHFWFRPFAGKIALSSKTTGKRIFVIVTIIKYLMRDMMDYHCLRVLRSRVRRIGKHSPCFSVFRTRVHGCSTLSRAVFRPRAPSWRSFFLAVSIIYARQVITVNKENEVHHPVCGVASCGGPGSFSAHMIFRILGRDVARPALTSFCGVEVINGWPVISISISAETPITLPSVTADISICNMESSDLVSNLSGMT